MEQMIDVLSLHIEQIIGVIMILFLLCMEAFCITWNKKMIEKKHRCTKKTKGTVISAERTFWSLAEEDSRYDQYKYSYRLQYQVGGQTYTVSSNAGYAYVGEKKTVYYNPDNPRDYELGGAFRFVIWVNYFVIAFFAFAIVVVIRFVVMVKPEDESDWDIEEEITDEFDLYDEIDVETEDDEQPPSQATPEDTIQNWDNMTYGDTVLMRQAQEDQVCIAVQPSMLRKYRFYYYIPEDEEQKRLQEFMETLLSEGKPYEGKWEGMKEKGWQIVYQDKWFMVFEGGYVQSTYLDETGEVMEYFAQAPDVCGSIQNMLQEKLNYDPFQPADIENIVSAKLDVCSRNTNNTFYSQTITDEETLQLFEDWFCNAEYILGGADCGNQDACLELTLADGDVVRLSIATDSCSNFGINGIYYDYRPTSDWDNREFFELFDSIPWEWD